MGAELFVSVSNDAWFPHSRLARQHFDHGRIRAVENGAPMLRSCNSGITCGIDAFGRTVQVVPPLKSQAEAAVFLMPMLSFPTLYTWWGDGAILAISFFAILTTIFFQKKKLL
jgi:apolipoprotein N-acyltransferase